MFIGADQRSFLGRVRPNAYRRARRMPHLGTEAPRVAGAIDAFVAASPTAQRALAARILYNPVKVCASCGKPNGYTLLHCNQCRTSLAAVPLSETPNLFSGFVLGIEWSGRFPLTISLRHEDATVMAFDDPLSLSPLHFCAVPSDVVMPDWRYFTLAPADGLRVHRRLLAACHAAAERDFFGDPAWTQSLLQPCARDWQASMLSGYNFPPSQNQLHIQYMSPVLMPHQRMMFLRGVHFTHRRFFPSEYVAACLEALAATGQRCTRAELRLPVEDFVTLLEERSDVAYDALHTAFLAKAEAAHEEGANWRPEHFEGRYTCAEGGVSFVPLPPSGSPHDAAETAEGVVSEPVVFAQEKKALENYGAQSNPVDRAMGYYSFSKALDELDLSFLKE